MVSWKENYFSPSPKIKLFYRTAIPEKPKGHIFLIHGYAEHSGRYRHVMEYFSGQGFAVYAPDHRGHGRSARVLGDMPSYEKVLSDLGAFKEYITLTYGASRIFLLGHSLGGNLVLSVGARYPENIKGAIAIAPMILIPDYVSPALLKISRIIAVLLPLLPIQRFQKEAVSHDEAVLESARRDPIYYRGKIRARTGAELIRGMEKAQSLLASFTLPLLLLHAGDDRIMPKEGSQFVMSRVASKDKTLKVFDGLYHEILNEPEKEMVFAAILGWINERNK
jgi:alpha-beta hydrolase superfamily lysophospholipase